MIAPLRQRHRFVFLGLALSLPLGFGLALRAKPKLAGAYAAALPTSAQLQGEGICSWTEGPFELRVDPNRQPMALELVPQELGQAPDVLAYWVQAGADPKTTGLPPGARLLGMAQGHPTTLLDAPPNSRLEAGEVWLYSLALQERIARFELGTGGRR